jgi:hypothetical protein
MDTADTSAHDLTRDAVALCYSLNSSSWPGWHHDQPHPVVTCLHPNRVLKKSTEVEWVQTHACAPFQTVPYSRRPASQQIPSSSAGA